MSNQTLTKQYTAETAIAANSLVKPGSTDAQPTTLNVNPGTISLLASSGGINVNANANMLVGGFMPSSGTTVTLNGVTQTAQRLYGKQGIP